MAYKKKSSFSKISKYSKFRVKKTTNPMTPRTATQTIKNYVKKTIASNIENKFTDTKNFSDYVCGLTTTSTGGPLPTPIAYATAYAWYAWAPGNNTTGTFQIAQGSALNQRTGNTIKLKKWMLKYSIQPTQNNVDISGTTVFARNSLQGYVDVYFGRYNYNVQPVAGALTSFYRNGATDITPTGSQTDKLAIVNTDVYKIYYHKRHKVGVGADYVFYSPSPTTFTAFGDPQVAGGIGFQPAVIGGFDICKYICKNKMLRYDELLTTPQSADIENLTLWCVFTPTCAPLLGNFVAGTVLPTPVFSPTLYKMNCMTYAEYEDA